MKCVLFSQPPGACTFRGVHVFKSQSCFAGIGFQHATMNVLLHFQSSFRRRQKWIVFSEIYVESLRMSFRKSISQTLVFGQLLGLMPICGITSDLSDLKFKWKSFRCLHFVVVLLGAASLLILTLLFLRQHQELSLENIDTVIVYSTNIVTIVLFFRLRHQWQRLIECWDNFECRLNLDNSELQRQSNLRLILVVASSLGNSSFTSIRCVHEFNLITSSTKKSWHAVS